MKRLGQQIWGPELDLPEETYAKKMFDITKQSLDDDKKSKRFDKILTWVYGQILKESTRGEFRLNLNFNSWLGFRKFGITDNEIEMVLDDLKNEGFEVNPACMFDDSGMPPYPSKTQYIVWWNAAKKTHLDKSK